jgi:hypothetical protein
VDGQPIRTRDELIGHIFRLLDDHDAIGDQWENKDLYSILQAMAAWLNDCEGYYINTGQAVDVRHPSWQLFADALSAASVYE